MAVVFDALRVNPEAHDTRFLVFSDGPINDKDLKSITEVRRSSRRHKKVNSHARPHFQIAMA